MYDKTKVLIFGKLYSDVLNKSDSMYVLNKTHISINIIWKCMYKLSLTC